jgi:hypothetical protein
MTSPDEGGSPQREPIARATFKLPVSELDALKSLARRRSITTTQALRQAISTELFVDELVQRGAKILVQEPDRTIQQVVFSQAQRPARATAGV